MIHVELSPARLEAFEVPKSFLFLRRIEKRKSGKLETKGKQLPNSELKVRS
jgi:hypothetical protein